MKKNLKKSKFVILPALATLVLTSVATITGTAAWFTASREVSASGMSFTAKSESNLLIAGDDLTNTAKKNEGEFSGSLSQQFASASLKPASTIDGINFFATSTAKADGSIQDGAKYEQATNPAEGFADRYYLDYVFQLKAINTGSTEQDIYVNQISVDYTAAKDTADTVVTALQKAAKAFRIAFFIENEKTEGNTAGTEFTADTTTVTDGKKIIYQPSDTHNQISTKAVKRASNDTDTAISDALDDVSYLSVKTAYTKVANGTHYYKGVARVWMEGEDVNCTSDLFQHAANNWSIKLGFRLGDVNTTEANQVAQTNIAVNVTKASA